MFPKPRRRNGAILKKDLRGYVKNFLSSQKSEIPPEIRLILDSGQSIAVRIIWIVVLLLCFTISVYQTYDRVKYYREKPISVNIFAEENERVNMMPFFITNLDMDDMAKYWLLSATNESIENPVTCGCPIRALLTQTNFVLTNATKLWLATNTTPAIEKLQVNYGGKSEGVFLKNGVIVNSTSDGERIFDITEINSVYGMSALIKKATPIKVGSRVKILLRRRGGCRGLQMPSIALYDLMPFRYITLVRFGTITRFANSITEYNFVNSAVSPCERDPKRVEKCLSRCLMKKYSMLPCRYPFMPAKLKLTECSSISNNSVNTVEVFDTARITYSFTSATVHCNCIRACVQHTVKINPAKEKIPDREIVIFEYQFNEQYTLVFREKFAYDGIALLVDIGGNLGLFLGLSIMSITQLGQLGVIYAYKRVKNLFTNAYTNNKGLSNQITKRIDKNLSKLQKDKTGKPKSLLSKYNFSQILTKIIMLFLTVFSVYMIFERIVYYLSTPTRSVVVITEDKLLFHPNLIVCGEGGTFLFQKRLLAKKLKLPSCDINFLEFIDLKQMSVQDLWKATFIQEDGFVLTAVLALTLKELGYNHSFTLMPDGLCHEYTFEQLPFGGIGSGYCFAFTEITSNCSQGMIQIYRRPPGEKIHSVMLSQQTISPNFRVAIALRTLKFERVNYAAKPCVNAEIFEKCRDDCVDAKIKSAIACRLPFMDTINQTWCNTTAAAKESVITFKKIAVQTDVRRECDCLPPCKQTVYQSFITFDEPGVNVNFAGSYPWSSLVENIIEVRSYSLVALLCDIGNSFGLTLGLSLLAALHGLKPCGKVLSNFFKST